jgi:hypothetical protein
MCFFMYRNLSGFWSLKIRDSPIDFRISVRIVCTITRVDYKRNRNKVKKCTGVFDDKDCNSQ